MSISRNTWMLLAAVAVLGIVGFVSVQMGDDAGTAPEISEEGAPAADVSE
ncbi:hypothetical protein [Salipiger mucosus]|uniref:Uncharacterized protein n=1 Tax=Salipiger mucosus DSM 16094 TaxID=1123237 RepID=S9RJL2_9RHOB|nr:hypothetical protein [Salipiger mucosus]EPX78305.1 hypothetical protein Salmuc_03921 [Salipiger mucosus DSM 16094]